MKKFRLSILLVAMFAALTLLAGCEKKEAPPASPPAPAPAAEAPAAQPVPPPAAVVPAQASSALPEPCEVYLAKIQECVQKNANNAATADMLKQQEAQMRETWTQTADKETLGAACQQASDIFAQNAPGMGC
ncbi:MAG: hypothetical protein LBS40_01950 [Burkholderiales bacterium]|jgi:hypothetical protein|nr:hypothetical protein [Burkholderiales bacterium]